MRQLKISGSPRTPGAPHKGLALGRLQFAPVVRQEIPDGKDERQLEALRSVALGRDPGAEKQEAREAKHANLLADVIDLYIERHCKPKNRSWRDTERLLNGEVLAVLGNRGITTITQKDVRDLLDGIVDRGCLSMANHTHAILRKFANWCQG